MFWNFYRTVGRGAKIGEIYNWSSEDVGRQWYSTAYNLRGQEYSTLINMYTKGTHTSAYKLSSFRIILAVVWIAIKSTAFVFVIWWGRSGAKFYFEEHLIREQIKSRSSNCIYSTWFLLGMDLYGSLFKSVTNTTCHISRDSFALNLIS